MRTKIFNLAMISTLALAFGLSAGCATTADLERVEKLAKEAKAAADAANKCCQDTNARIDKMFKQSQKK